MLKRFWVLVLLAPAVGGCDALGYLGYLLAPEPPQKEVKAEYKGLAGRNVAVVIFADQAVQYEHPYVRLEAASLISAELRKQIKGVKLVDPKRVVKYQDENLHWDSKDKTELGQALGADYVLYVSLVEFSTLEPGSLNLYRGRISAEAALYQTSLPEGDARVWRGTDFRVTFPEDGPIGELRERDVETRYQTLRLLAERLVRKFHDHKVREEE